MCQFLLKMQIEENPNLAIENKWDAFLQGGAVLLRGLLTVFAVLCIIWFCLFLVRKIIELMSGQAQAQAQKKAPEPAPAPQVVAPVPTVSADSELIAVIAAAISAAEAESGHGGFRVVSFRRVNK